MCWIQIVGRPLEIPMLSNCPRVDNQEDLDSCISKDPLVKWKYTEKSDVSIGRANT